jgi:hypothetical protein
MPSEASGIGPGSGGVSSKPNRPQPASNATRYSLRTIWIISRAGALRNLDRVAHIARMRVATPAGAVMPHTLTV